MVPVAEVTVAEAARAVPSAVAAAASAVAVRAVAAHRGSGKWRARLACANQRRYADGFMSLFGKLFI